MEEEELTQQEAESIDQYFNKDWEHKDSFVIRYSISVFEGSSAGAFVGAFLKKADRRDIFIDACVIKKDTYEDQVYRHQAILNSFYTGQDDSEPTELW